MESYPIRAVNRECHKCPFGKERLCDYPHPGLDARRLSCLGAEKERLEKELVQVQSMLIPIEERIVEGILRQACRP